ncbi:MAG: protein-disulfide reductase DsbD [Candidatus Saccharibacteria bacterium]|nr:protein-disulfide reductase DsbD [Moraxellaceae bacterium]
MSESLRTYDWHWKPSSSILAIIKSTPLAISHTVMIQRSLFVLIMLFTLLMSESAQAIAASNNNNNAAVNNSASSNDFDKKTLLGGIKFEGINEFRNANSTSKFIPADQAFKLVGEAKDNKLVLDFQVTSGYYLYQRKFAFYSSNPTVKLQDAIFSRAAQIKDDPEFGKVPVYHDDVSIGVPYSGSGKVTVRWQGCADAGLCYPPQEREFNLPPANTAVSASNTSSQASSADTTVAANTTLAKASPPIPAVDGRPDIRTKIEKSAGVQSILLPLPIPNDVSGYRFQIAPSDKQVPTNVNAITSPSTDIVDTEDDPPSMMIDQNELVPRSISTMTSIATPTPITQNINTDPFGLGRHPLTAFALLFLAGLGLVFTPCVLPMLPIVANLVARQHRRSMAHGLLLSGAYAVGIASCYAVLGAVIAKFGQQFNLLGWLQNPIVLIVFAIVFVILALANFDVFTLRLPHGIQSKIHAFEQREAGRAAWLRQGSVVGSWLTGFVSALVVSPCVSAPLAGVLLSVSTVGSPLLGAIALFMLGLGLGVPLMILGATEGRFLPKAGEWLNWVRQGFGLLLFGVALILLNRAFDSSLMLLLWATLSMACAVWFWRWAGRGRFVTQVCAVMIAGWGLVQLAGVAAGQTDPWHPLTGLTKKPFAVKTVSEIHSLAELSDMQQQHPQLLVDVTADWCVSCRIMERELFSGQDIKGLTGWTRVKLDVTNSDENSKEVLKKLNLFGPPVLIFYKQGQEVGRVVGETKADGLAQALEKL